MNVQTCKIQEKVLVCSMTFIPLYPRVCVYLHSGWECASQAFKSWPQKQLSVPYFLPNCRNRYPICRIRKMAAARVNLESSTRTRRFREGQKKYIWWLIRCVLSCLDSMLVKTRSRLNPRSRQIYEFVVFQTRNTNNVNRPIQRHGCIKPCTVKWDPP